LGHDWEFILNQLGIAHLDRTIGAVIYSAGVLVMVASLAVAMRATVRNSE